MPAELMTQFNKYKRGYGFTLIEVAIVLIIAALLMGATLKGQQLINVAKEKQLEADFNNISLMIYGYQDKYKALPGDDKNATYHFAGAQTIIHNGDGEGLILGNWFDFNPVSDNTLIWQHLRLAGLMEGDISLSSPRYIPQNSLGKPIDIQSGVSNSNNAPIKSLLGDALHGGYIICSRGIPGEMALSLDIRLDDGNPATGKMLATPDINPFSVGAIPATVGTNTATDITSAKLYIVCLGV